MAALIKVASYDRGDDRGPALYVSNAEVSEFGHSEVSR